MPKSKFSSPTRDSVHVDLDPATDLVVLTTEVDSRKSVQVRFTKLQWEGVVGAIRRGSLETVPEGQWVAADSLQVCRLEGVVLYRHADEPAVVASDPSSGLRPFTVSTEAGEFDLPVLEDAVEEENDTPDEPAYDDLATIT